MSNGNDEKVDIKKIREIAAKGMEEYFWGVVADPYFWCLARGKPHKECVKLLVEVFRVPGVQPDPPRIEKALKAYLLERKTFLEKEIKAVDRKLALLRRAGV
jgi:hypothetical protein